MKEIVGKLQGLKASSLQALEGLYDFNSPSHLLVAPALAKAAAVCAADLGRMVAALVNRKGLVEHVILGEQTRLYLPDIGRQRAGSTRLRGLRLIVAKPRRLHRLRIRWIGVS